MGEEAGHGSHGSICDNAIINQNKDKSKAFKQVNEEVKCRF